MHHLKFFILRSVMLPQFRKSVGPCSSLYKYNEGVVITLYYNYIVKRLFSFQNEHFLYFLTAKKHAGLKDEAFSTRYDYVNGDVAKTGDKSSIHCRF